MYNHLFVLYSVQTETNQFVLYELEEIDIYCFIKKKGTQRLIMLENQAGARVIIVHILTVLFESFLI